MKLQLIRKWKTDKSTIGELFVDGKFFCFTLEDVERPAGVKVYGQTAIPKGTYKLVVDFSPKFQRRVPHVLDVPGFEGIRIHKGNTDHDTEGCILVGMNREKDMITQSTSAYEKLFRLLDGAADVTLEVS